VEKSRTIKQNNPDTEGPISSGRENKGIEQGPERANARRQAVMKIRSSFFRLRNVRRLEDHRSPSAIIIISGSLCCPSQKLRLPQEYALPGHLNVSLFFEEPGFACPAVIPFHDCL
jgi:hypothetical protein